MNISRNFASIGGFSTIMYILLCCIIGGQTQIFEYGIYQGVFCALLYNIPCMHIYFYVMAISLTKVLSGEFFMYIILGCYLCTVNFISRYCEKYSKSFKTISTLAIYIPSFFIFKITPIFHLLNYIMCIGVAYLSEDIFCTIKRSGKISALFSKAFPNCFFMFVLGMGCCNFSVWKIDMFFLFFSFFVLYIAKMSTDRVYLFFMVFYSMAGYICGKEYALPIMAVSILVVLSIAEWNKGVTVLMYISIVIFATFLTKNTSSFSLPTVLSCLVGSLIFLFSSQEGNMEINNLAKVATQKEVINRDRGKIAMKIDELASCFWRIASSYRKLSSGKITPQLVGKYISKETIRNVCECCQNAEYCNKNKLAKDSEIDYLAYQATKKGKATLLDFGEYISSHCINKVEINTEINKQASNISAYMARQEEKNKCREEVARTYQRVSEILKKLSTDASKKISYDSKAEEKISESLDRFNILYRELFIYQNENKCICVEMLAQSEDFPQIANCIENIFGESFYIAKTRLEEELDLNYVSFEQSPRLKIDCGFSTKPKKSGDKNGDTMTILNLPNGKFICSICDGMGSGEEASEFSTKTINFIENLFGAGFATSDIIASVNGFMENCEYDSYATLDILEIDKYTQTAYLYKVGSPDTIYHSKKTHQISSKALPIGILKDIKVEINSIKLQDGDRIIISSDGILDYMKNEIVEACNVRSWESSQQICDIIMQGCDRKMKIKKPDDRTIIVLEIEKS